MPRLVSSVTGITVDVDEETAGYLSKEWVPEGSSERSSEPDKTWKVAELKAYAEENGVDLGDATKKDDILAAIVGGEPDEDPEDQSDNEPEADPKAE